MIAIRQNKEKIKASRNLTLIVIFKCIIYLVCLTPYLIFYMIRYVSSELINKYNLSFKIFYDFSEILLIISHGINFFIYLKFNKLFRRSLINYFRKIFYTFLRK